MRTASDFNELLKRPVTDWIDKIQVETLFDFEPVFFIGVKPEDIKPQTSVTIMTKFGFGIRVIGTCEFIDQQEGATQ
jgi:hypothetical protein